MGDFDALGFVQDGTPPTTRIRLPDGRVGTVPTPQLQAALALGAEVVDE